MAGYGLVGLGKVHNHKLGFCIVGPGKVLLGVIRFYIHKVRCGLVEFGAVVFVGLRFGTVWFHVYGLSRRGMVALGRLW